MPQGKANFLYLCLLLKFELQFPRRLRPPIFCSYGIFIIVYFQPEEKVVEEAKGRIRYRLEYDFTTQELKITVSTNYKQHLTPEFDARRCFLPLLLPPL